MQQRIHSSDDCVIKQHATQKDEKLVTLAAVGGGARENTKNVGVKCNVSTGAKKNTETAPRDTETNTVPPESTHKSGKIVSFRETPQDNGKQSPTTAAHEAKEA